MKKTIINHIMCYHSNLPIEYFQNATYEVLLCYCHPDERGDFAYQLKKEGLI